MNAVLHVGGRTTWPVGVINRIRQVLLFVGALLTCAASSSAQTVYHLHQEPVDDFFTENCSYSLKTASPDSAVLAITSVDLKNKPVGVGTFAVHFATTWLAIFLFLQGPMRVPFLRWRFRGGRIL